MRKITKVSKEAYLLLSKPNGKELDPRHFSTEEREAFRKSDAKEWTSWIENKVVRRLSDEEIKNLNPNDVFRAPARLIRVNKGELHGTFQPKSRLVVPGHLDHTWDHSAQMPQRLHGRQYN